MAYHEKGTRVRVVKTVVIPQYRSAPIVVMKGCTGTVVKSFPGEEAYSVLLDGTKDADNTDFLYDYEVEALTSEENGA